VTDGQTDGRAIAYMLSHAKNRPMFQGVIQITLAQFLFRDMVYM